MINLNVFGERMRQAREDKGLTVRELAVLLETTSATISRYENAIHEPKSQTLSRIAEILGVTAAWLMGLDVEKYPVYEINPVYYKKIPILGTIAAGQPMMVMENTVGYETVTDELDFCLRVKGDSMIGARIYDGDLVYIRQQSDVADGEIAAVLIDGQEATLKRVYKRPDTIILHAENPTYPDQVFTKRDYKEIKILGKVKYVKFEAR